MILGNPANPLNPAAREVDFERPQGNAQGVNNPSFMSRETARKLKERLKKENGRPIGSEPLNPAMYNEAVYGNEVGSSPVGGLDPRQGQMVAMDVMPPLPEGRCPSQKNCINRIAIDYARVSIYLSENPISSQSKKKHFCQTYT